MRKASLHAFTEDKSATQKTALQQPCLKLYIKYTSTQQNIYLNHVFVSWNASVGDAWMRLAGAHNTIVTARAGKDLVSCLVSGLLTIGPRFGGAVDDAARYFQDACDRGDDHATTMTSSSCTKLYKAACSGQD